MIKLCAFADEASSALDGQIKALNENNIPYIEVRGINGKSVINFTNEEAKDYCTQLADNGVAVWSIGSPLGKVDIRELDKEDYLKNVRHICRLANIFKTNRVRVFSFFNGYEEKEKVFSYLQAMVDLAKEYGVELYHENEKDIYGDTVERVSEILEKVTGLKSVYDPTNFIQVGEDTKTALERLFSKTDYFHIKDVVRATKELVPAGYGDGRINELIECIESDKTLTLEPHLAVFSGYAQIDSTEMKHKFPFKNNTEAFDFAVTALKTLLQKAGYKEIDGGFIK